MKYAFREKNPTALKNVNGCLKELLMITMSGKASLYLSRKWGNKNLVNTKFHGVKTMKTPVKIFTAARI